jgi:hypothetical protein
VRHILLACSVRPFPHEKQRRLFRVGLLASADDRLNLSRPPCCRASLAKFVCFCALAPRGAPRLLAPDTTPKQSHFESGVFVPLRLANLLAGFLAKYLSIYG